MTVQREDREEREREREKERKRERELKRERERKILLKCVYEKEKRVYVWREC